MKKVRVRWVESIIYEGTVEADNHRDVNQKLCMKRPDDRQKTEDQNLNSEGIQELHYFCPEKP